jgi:cell division protein FtsX
VCECWAGTKACTAGLRNTALGQQMYLINLYASIMSILFILFLHSIAMFQNFERTLTSWEDKRKIDTYRSSRPRLNSQQSMEYLTEEECAQVQQLGMVADTLITRYSMKYFMKKSLRKNLIYI